MSGRLRCSKWYSIVRTSPAHIATPNRRPQSTPKRTLEGFRNPASDGVEGARHPGSREQLGLAVLSREWIQHLHVRFSEIVCVSGDDDKIVNERRRCDQTVLYRHRFTGLAQFSQKLCPSKAGERVPWNADDSRDALIEPGFESTTSLPRR
jgi:hypothetical protein